MVSLLRQTPSSFLHTLDAVIQPSAGQLSKATHEINNNKQQYADTVLKQITDVVTYAWFPALRFRNRISVAKVRKNSSVRIP